MAKGSRLMLSSERGKLSKAGRDPTAGARFYNQVAGIRNRYYRY
jgi:hypothetical protein